VSLTGTTIADRYEIAEKLGAGGMAVVYRAQDALLQRPVTVKVLRGEFAADENVVRRFRREAQAAAALSHPNIVGVYDVGRQEEIHYIVMEYIQGKTLKEVIADRGPLPADEAVRVARQIAEALKHAHAHRIIHRDVKPHNVLITDEGRVKVTDFGIAGAATGTTVTYPGALLGTVYYFSPEQAQGRYGDERSDLYALGVVLYEMLTGKLPFEGESPVSVALKHIRETATSPRELNPRVPPAAERVVMKAMAKEVDRRYQSAAEMIRELDALRRQLGEWRSRGRPVAAPDVRDNTQVVGRITPGARRRDATRPGVKPGAGAAAPAAAAGGGPASGSHGGSRGGGGSRPMGDGPGKDYDPTFLDLEDERVTPARPKRRLSGATVWIAAFAAFFILVGLGLFWVVQLFEVPEVSVPNVVGLNLEQAYARLGEFNLNGAVVSSENNADYPSGAVFDQKPAAGTMVKANRTINLWVSKGPALVDKVPDVIGLTWREAVIQLEAAGLEADENDFTYSFSDTVGQDRVISQDPPAGTRNVTQGTNVRLEISQGPFGGTVVVPDFTGQNIDAALAVLEGLGLTRGDVSLVESTEPAGTILSQNPPPATSVASGSPVSFTVSGQPGGSDPGVGEDDTHESLVHFQIPDEPSSQTVRIVVTDAEGQRTVYGEREHAAGYEGWILVAWVGDTLRVQIFYNGALSEDYYLSPGDGE